MEHQCGVGVAEGVEGTARVMLMDVGIDIDLDGAQSLGREDHTVNSERLRVLPFAERRQHIRWNWNRPVTILRLAGCQPVGGVACSGPLLADLERSGRKVDTVPRQPPDLSDSHTRPAGHQHHKVVERVPAMLLEVVQNLSDFLPAEGSDRLFSPVLYLGDFRSRVRLDDLVCHGMAEYTANSCQGEVLRFGGKGQAIDLIHQHRRCDVLDGQVQYVWKPLDSVLVGQDGTIGQPPLHITLENGPELAQGDGLQGFIECDANLFLSGLQKFILVLPGLPLGLETLPSLLPPAAADFVGQNQTNRAVLFTVAEMVIHRSYLLL